MLILKCGTLYLVEKIAPFLLVWIVLQYQLKTATNRLCSGTLICAIEDLKKTEILSAE